MSAAQVLEKAKEIWGEFNLTEAGTHAPSTAFFFFLSMIPLIIIYASIVSASGIDAETVTKFLGAMMPESVSGLIASIVQEAYDKSDIAFSLSIFTLLWSASRGIRALRRGLNAVYGIEETRSGLVVILISLASVVVLIIMLTAALFLMFNGGIMWLVEEFFPDISDHTQLLASLDPLILIVFGTITFDICYTFLAAGKRSFLKQLPGAIVAAVSWSVLSYGFSIYVDCFSNYTLLYGSLAAVALFLFWMYLIFYILFAGGFINRLRKER